MQPTLTIQLIPTLEGQNYQVLKFSGEFDKAGQSNVKEELDKIITSFALNSLVLDFSQLKFINSEGIGYIMEIHTHLIKKDKKVVIIGANSHVKDVFKTIGINEIVPVYENLNSFLNK